MLPLVPNKCAAAHCRNGRSHGKTDTSNSTTRQATSVATSAQQTQLSSVIARRKVYAKKRSKRLPWVIFLARKLHDYAGTGGRLWPVIVTHPLVVVMVGEPGTLAVMTLAGSFVGSMVSRAAVAELPMSRPTTTLPGLLSVYFTAVPQRGRGKHVQKSLV